MMLQERLRRGWGGRERGACGLLPSLTGVLPPRRDPGSTRSTEGNNPQALAEYPIALGWGKGRRERGLRGGDFSLFQAEYMVGESFGFTTAMSYMQCCDSGMYLH